MSEGFDPSPRALKRRRTATHSIESPVVNEQDSEQLSLVSQDRPTPARKSRRSKAQQEDTVTGHTYGAKERDPMKDRTAEVEHDGTATARTGSLAQEQIPSPAKRRPEIRHTASSPSAQRPLKSVDHSDDAPVPLQPRSSGRERRRPRRFSTSPEAAKPTISANLTQSASEVSHQDSPIKPSTVTPKSILTPSKKGRVRPRKSVVFDKIDGSAETELGFKDIDPSIKSVKKGTATPAAQVPPTERELGGRQLTTLTTMSKPKVTLDHTQSVSGIEPDPEEDDGLIQRIAHSQIVTDVVRSADTDTVTTADPDILDIKTEIVSRLVGSAPFSARHIPEYLQSQYSTLCNLLTATITTGESNSILLLGSRGAGKTYLLNTAIGKLLRKHGDDFHVVRLNGFFQTDDKVALREIWRQLGKEMNIDEMETEGVSSYADTMASLLSLLSHPDELLESSSGPSSVTKPESVATTSKSVVFVLDEFDLFTTHPRQTLLYNLFDIAQSKKAPIAVIGCSTRMDVVECLEKRVKSRFSHRWLHVPSVRNLDGFEALVRNMLTIEASQNEENVRTSARKAVEARDQWNDYIKDLLRRIFYTTRSIPDLLTALYHPVATLDVFDRHLQAETGTTIYTSNARPPLLELLPTLPTLHLSLLVAAARLDTIYNLAAFNFNVVFDHYSELIKRSKLQQTASGTMAIGAGLRRWTFESAQRAWEDLSIWQMIIPVSGRATSGGASSGLGMVMDIAGGEGASTRTWRIDITLEDLDWALKQEQYGQAIDDENRSSVTAGAVVILSKWCREI